MKRSIICLMVAFSCLACRKEIIPEEVRISGIWELQQTERFCKDSLVASTFAEAGAVHYEFIEGDGQSGEWIIHEEGQRDSMSYEFINEELISNTGLRFQVISLSKHDLILSNSWDEHQLRYHFFR